MTFAQRIVAIRKEKKLTQEKLGELVSMTQRSVAAWEGGSRFPSLPVLVELAEKLGVTVDFLLGVDHEETKKEPAVITDDELRSKVISRLQDLSDPALARVSDFLDGLQAGQEVAAAQAAAPDPDGAPAE